MFAGYFEAVFRRERDKPQVGLQKILQEHGAQIRELHERVGFELQVRSEQSEQATAALTEGELRDVAWNVLADAGFKPSEEDRELLDKVVTAVTLRLVLLAPQRDEGYGFDVRSLQELMAARHMTNAVPQQVQSQLQRIAANPHWRNTWIFAAGRIFSTPETHRYDALMDLVLALDQDAPARLGSVAPVGPRLALELIDDGMARSLPKWRDPLIRHGLRVLNEPQLQDLLLIARVLVRFANNGDSEQKIVAEGIRAALALNLQARATVLRLQEVLRSVAEGLDARPVTHWLDAIKPDLRPMVAVDPAWSDFEEEVATHPLPGAAAPCLAEAAAACRRLQDLPDVDAADVESIQRALRSPDVADGLASALMHVTPSAERLVVRLRDQVLPEIHRTPVGEALLLPAGSN